MKESFASHVGFQIYPANLSDDMANTFSPSFASLEVVGEVHCDLLYEDKTFELDAFIVKHLSVDVLAGIPFQMVHDIGVRPAKQQVIIHCSEIVSYGPEQSMNNADDSENIDVCYDFHPSTLATEDFMYLPTDKWMVEHPLDGPLIYSAGSTTPALDNTAPGSDPHNTEICEFDPGEVKCDEMCLAPHANYLSLSSTRDEMLVNSTRVCMDNEMITCSMQYADNPPPGIVVNFMQHITNVVKSVAIIAQPGEYRCTNDIRIQPHSLSQNVTTALEKIEHSS